MSEEDIRDCADAMEYAAIDFQPSIKGKAVIAVICRYMRYVAKSKEEAKFFLDDFIDVLRKDAEEYFERKFKI